MIRVVNHGKGRIGLGHGREPLRPGFNDVDPAAWDAVKGTPMIRALLDLGKDGGLTVGGVGATPAPSPQPDVSDDATPPRGVPAVETEPVAIPDLGEMNARNARETVAACDDPDVLAAWLRTEDRKTVVEAIDKRLARLQNTDD
jgi:hypothetical protein